MAVTGGLNNAAVDPLAGWTVGVTAARRSDEQADLLARRGVQVLLAPLVRAERSDDGELRSVTRALVERPPDVMVGVTGAGVAAWVASAWSWGYGEALLEVLGGATVLARGAVSCGALVGEGIPVAWRGGGTLAELQERILAEGVAGRRVAVQLPGRELPAFTGALQGAGAEVVRVPVYRLVPPRNAEPVERLVQALDAGQLDAVTFTSLAAVRNLVDLGGATAVERLNERGVLCACVGPVTAEGARAAGLRSVASASPSRLGSLVGLLAGHLGARRRVLHLAGMAALLQGSRLEVDGREVRLTPRERLLLDAMVAADGAVLSKRILARSAWEGPVSEHAVEVTVNRLRRKLGAAAAALETTNRRGYRLAATSSTSPEGSGHSQGSGGPIATAHHL